VPEPWRSARAPGYGRCHQSVGEQAAASQPDLGPRIQLGPAGRLRARRLGRRNPRVHLDTVAHQDFQRLGIGRDLVRAVTGEAFKAGLRLGARRLRAQARELLPERARVPADTSRAPRLARWAGATRARTASMHRMPECACRRRLSNLIAIAVQNGGWRVVVRAPSLSRWVAILSPLSRCTWVYRCAQVPGDQAGDFLRVAAELLREVPVQP
jgi:GNAT superfamily N-acetyltransferase